MEPKLINHADSNAFERQICQQFCVCVCVCVGAQATVSEGLVTLCVKKLVEETKLYLKVMNASHTHNHTQSHTHTHTHNHIHIHMNAK